MASSASRPVASERARASTSPRPISSGSSTSARATAAGAPISRAPAASAARSLRSMAVRSASAARAQAPQERADEADVAQVDLELADPSARRSVTTSRSASTSAAAEGSPISSAPSWKISRRRPTPSGSWR
jgi:hypothetical protein